MDKFPPVNWNYFYDNFTPNEDWIIAEKFYKKKVDLIKKSNLINKLSYDKIKIIVGYDEENKFTSFLKNLNTEEVLVKKIISINNSKDYDIIFLNYENYYLNKIEKCIMYNINKTLKKNFNYVKLFNLKKKELLIIVSDKLKNIINLFLLLSKQYGKLKN